MGVQCEFCKAAAPTSDFDSLLKARWASSLTGIVVCPECLESWGRQPTADLNGPSQTPWYTGEQLEAAWRQMGGQPD